MLARLTPAQVSPFVFSLFQKVMRVKRLQRFRIVVCNNVALHINLSVCRYFQGGQTGQVARHSQGTGMHSGSI